MRQSQPRQEGPDRIEPALQHETQHAAESAHLPPGDVVAGMRSPARIKYLAHLRTGLQELRDLKGAFVLLPDAQVQRLHSPQQQIGGRRIERRAGDFAMVIDSLDQFLGSAYHAAQRVRVATEKLRGAVQHEIRRPARVGSD